jgi:hypothetical protein
MNSWDGGFHRPTGEGSARAPTPARLWPAHDCQTALNPVGFLPGLRRAGGIGLRERLPARCLAPYHFHRRAMRDVVRGSSTQALKRTAAGSGVRLSIGLAAA